MKKHVYRPGDTVRIINPRFIKRVGYLLHWMDLIDTEEVEDLAVAMLMQTGRRVGKTVPRYFLQAVAKLLVEERGFGGNERQIIYADNVPADWGGCLATVTRKRVAYTGTRIPERSGTSYGYDGADDWYKPGGLDNRKTHILLTLDYIDEIEACNVELVRAAP